MKLSPIVQSAAALGAALLFMTACGSGGNKTIGQLTRDIRSTPDNPDGYAKRGLAYLETAEYEKARADFRRASELQPGNPTFHVLVARAEIGLKQYNAAVARCLSARTFNPNLQALYWVRGQALHRLGQDSAAFWQFDSSVRLDLKNTEPRLRRVEFFLETDRDSEALLDCRKAIIVDSGDAAAYSLRAKAFAAVGRSDSSFLDLDRAVRLDSTNPRYLRELARAYGERRDPRTAVRLYNRALEYGDRLSVQEHAGIKEALARLSAE